MRERGPRYERTRPNELWHIDIKGPFFIHLAAGGFVKTWIVGMVDDHSRFVIGLRIHTDAQAAPILRWLEDCFELCGQPLELMSDNGLPFVTWMPYVSSPGLASDCRSCTSITCALRSTRRGPTERSRRSGWCCRQRSWTGRCCHVGDAEVALTSFLTYYNYHRLSGVLGWATPAERYDGTPFLDRGFTHIPALSHLQPWLDELMQVA